MLAKFSKKVRLVIALTVLLSLPLSSSLPLSRAAETNRIANADVESGTPGIAPENWNIGSWGVNESIARYEYVSEIESNAVGIEITSYESGDAKWYFDTIAVSPDTTYTYGNSYRSTTESAVVARFTLQDDSFLYGYIGDVAASASWTSFSEDILVPQGVTQLTVFHLINTVGELWADDFSLTEKIVPHYDTLIANPSVEDEVSGNPYGWTASSWGNNNATFAHTEDAHSGNKGLYVQLADYEDGDAKWVHEPATLEPGEDYEFTNFYKSNISTRIIMTFARADQTVFYQELPTAPASTAWTQYSSSFTMPLDAVTATAMHIISAEGYLNTDDYRLAPYTPIGFDRALLTLTFDDGWEENYLTAIPQMNAYGYSSNQFYATTFIRNPSIPNWRSALLGIRDQGHEIGSHTVNHPDLTTLPRHHVSFELKRSKQFLERLYRQPIDYFASPFGAYNTSALSQIMQTYTFHRTVNAGYNSKDNFDISQIRVQNILDTTSEAEVAAWIDKAQEDKTWLVLVYHRVADDPEAYDTTPAEFAEHLKEIDTSDIPVVTVSEALAELTPQL